MKFPFSSVSRMAMVGILVLTMASPSAAIPQKGRSAPPFKVVSTSGQSITLDNYRGYVLLLDFFATWCSPCREAVAHLNDLQRRYGKQGLQILGMSVDAEEDKAVRNFVSDRKLSYPVAFSSQQLLSDYGVRSIPTLFLVDKRGVVVGKYMGLSDEIEKSLEMTIKRLLAE